TDPHGRPCLVRRVGRRAPGAGHQGPATVGRAGRRRGGARGVLSPPLPPPDRRGPLLGPAVRVPGGGPGLPARVPALSSGAGDGPPAPSVLSGRAGAPTSAPGPPR